MKDSPSPKKMLVNAAKPSLLRVLISIFYDLWLIAAIWLLGAILDTGIRSALDLSAGEGNYFLLQAWFVLSPLLFYGWFWTHGGQTLGMRAWRVRVVNAQGESIGWEQALKRYFSALFSWLALGLGFAWILFDRENCSWHDRLSGSYLVVTEKRKKDRT